jgi:hypothetical protein
LVGLSPVLLWLGNEHEGQIKKRMLPFEDDMKASEAELRQEIDQIKRRVSSLEKAFDSILTKDDSEAIEDGRQDLAHGRTVTLSEVKKRS